MRFIGFTLAASALLLTVSCSSEKAAGVAVSKAFRTVIPSSVKALAGLDLKALRKSPLYLRHAAEWNAVWPDAEKLGVDLRRDVDSLSFAWDGQRALVFAEGRFDARKLETKMTAQGEPRNKVAQYTVVGGASGALAFLSNSAVLAGPLEAVRSAINTQENGTGEVPEEFIQRLRTLPSSDEIWLVSRGGIPLTQAPLRSDMVSNLANFTTSITGVTVGLGIDSGARLQATLSCVSADGATRVHDGLRGVIGFGRLSTRNDQTDLLKIYDALQVNKENTVVRVHADLPADQAERLLSLVPQRRAPH